MTSVAVEHSAAGNSWLDQIMIMGKGVIPEHSAVTEKVDAVGMVVVHMDNGVLMRTGGYGNSLFNA